MDFKRKVRACIAVKMSISKYNLGKELGRGSFGSVFMATHKDNGDKFAIKVVENYDPTTTATEVAILRTISNDYIIKYYESFYDTKGLLNIVMEFADCGTMQDSVEKTGVRTEEYCIWRVIGHISSALNYLHTLKPRHVLHRDLKPANVLGLNVWQPKFNENRIAWKIADFGIAELLNQNSQGEYYAQTDDGTPIYMAPEVCFCPI